MNVKSKRRSSPGLPGAKSDVLGTDIANGLYTLAAEVQVAALSILTVSDSLVTGESATAEQRERDFLPMGEVALAISP